LVRRQTHVLVIDSEGFLRDGLCALLQQDGSLQLDGAFGNARSAIRSRGNLQPHVVVLRNDRSAELFKAIAALAARRHYISTSVLQVSARANGRTPAHAVRRSDTAAMLTKREQEVVAMIAEGYRTREMAELLSVSHKTVERHRTNLMRKLGVRSATGVVAYAITHGYVSF
jgi:DNA-binding NarL/FixJ family response regulator